MLKIHLKLNICLALSVLLFFACSQPKSKTDIENKSNEIVEVEKDSSLLFDGKTLDGWQITEYGTQGPVMVSEGKIVLAYGDGCTGITWQKDFPKNNYEVSLEAQKTVGNDFFCGITFPVNDEFCSLIVGGGGGPVVGLSCIDGNDAAHNETQILKKFDKNVWYRIRVKVTNERITACIDDEQIVDFSYTGHCLSVRAEVILSKPFGIITWETTGEIRNIRLTKF